MVRPTAIAIAPNGARRTKADHPRLPMTPEEIAAEAARSLDAGAAMLHLHVRDRQGRHLLDASAYRQATATIRSAVGQRLVVQITTEAAGSYGPDTQMAVARAARPEAVSLALRELVADAAHEKAFAAFMEWLAREAVMTQIILYDAADAARLADLRRRGLVGGDTVHVLYVLGRYAAGQTSEPADLLPFLAAAAPLPVDFMVCAFGARETACVTAGALFGGDMRVGFENNLLLPDGRVAPDNASLVSAAASAVASCGIPLADADALRARWLPRR
ncbi:MAG: 3-keto-5-aminohexanoate cleavage enzyme [Alphaproteobacteria bacterium]|nr:MAG: 3-keto-5-aminohexanoate cleavage enzyme [Alphaproteobacteria bacterium]